MAGLDPAPSALLYAVYKHGNLPTDLHGHDLLFSVYSCFYNRLIEPSGIFSN